MKNAKNLTVSAIVLAISFIFLYMSSIMPSAKLACLAISTAGICIVIMEAGKKFGFLSSVVLCILSWFFVPDKTVSILFILFFSYYPLIKVFAEHQKRITEWIIKIIYFYVITVITVLVFKFLGLVPEAAAKFLNGPVAVAAVSLVVLAECVFDYALSMILSFYMSRIMPAIGKNRF